MPNFARISYNLLRALSRLKWDRSRLEEYQNKRLRRIVRYAYGNVPFYRRLFKSVGVSPYDVKSASDLNKLPVVRKSDMKKLANADLISKEFSVNDLKVLETGGSTGEPFSVYISKKEDYWRKAIYLRANISCGQRPRDVWVAVLNAERTADTTFVQHSLGIFAQKPRP